MPSSGTHRKKRSGRRRGSGFFFGSLLHRLKIRTMKGTLSPSQSLAAVLAVAMVAALIWFWVDLSFYVYAAEMDAGALTSTDELYRAAGLHGLSVFFVNREAVQDRVREALPAVRQVEVRCALPNRVSLIVQEEPGRVIWHTGQGEFLIDSHGRALRRVDGNGLDLPRIHDLDARTLLPGELVDRVAVAGAIELHRLLDGVVQFEYSQVAGLVVPDARGWRVYFGDNKSLPEKVATMRALVERVVSTRSGATVIDVRFLGGAYYR